VRSGASRDEGGRNRGKSDGANEQSFTPSSFLLSNGQRQRKRDSVTDGQEQGQGHRQGQGHWARAGAGGGWMGGGGGGGAYVSYGIGP